MIAVVELELSLVRESGCDADVVWEFTIAIRLSSRAERQGIGLGIRGFNWFPSRSMSGVIL